MLVTMKESVVSETPRLLRQTSLILTSLLWPVPFTNLLTVKKVIPLVEKVFLCLPTIPQCIFLIISPLVQFAVIFQNMYIIESGTEMRDVLPHQIHLFGKVLIFLIC